MSRHLLLSTVSVVAFLTSSLPAAAQPSPERGTVFIGAGAFAAIEKAPTVDGFGADQDNSGTVAGGQIGAGVHLTRRVSARFEWALTDWLTTDESGGLIPLAGLTTALGRGLAGFGVTGSELSIVGPRFEQRRKTMTGSVLLGYHLGEGRVALEVLGGLAFVHEEVESDYDVRILSGTGLTVPGASYRTSTYRPAAVVGADVAVALTDHAAVVPSVRAYSLNNGLSLRPGLGLRWTF